MFRADILTEASSIRKLNVVKNKRNNDEPMFCQVRDKSANNDCTFIHFRPSTIRFIGVAWGAIRLNLILIFAISSAARYNRIPHLSTRKKRCLWQASTRQQPDVQVICSWVDFVRIEYHRIAKTIASQPSRMKLLIAENFCFCCFSMRKKSKWTAITKNW